MMDDASCLFLALLRSHCLNVAMNVVSISFGNLPPYSIDFLHDRIAVLRFAADMLGNIDVTRRRNGLPPLARESLFDGNMRQRRSAAVQVAPERRLAIDLQSLFRLFHGFSARGHIAPKHRIFYTISFFGVKGRADKKTFRGLPPWFLC